ncbi:FUSC family protein [Jeongeupia chitinilytica]|uniref:Integral membrane bound transporter domain-containing protein n=1 Tax=Jeongeupia chitinilytica TaxID=1041641 RepID=A0ABQ3H364_9NEIS|nr:FUSC family protein [Jeongeupia chitinilytica]GHD65071.1 hypothetical protein GCM10007350_25230 [Jeongeupia chitinilytica]
MRLPLHLLQLRNDPLPWRKAVCALVSVTLPALVAVWRGEPLGLLFAAIGGLYASMVDFGGAFSHRLLTQLGGLVLIVASAALGVLMSAEPYWLLPLLALLAFGVGWCDGTNLALETILRMAVLALLIYGFTPGLPAGMLPYAVLGVATGMVAVGLDGWLFRHRHLSAQDPLRLRRNLLRIRGGATAGWRHALAFSSVVSMALLIALALHFERPAWVAASTLFVLRPDGPDSLRRLFQTCIGTMVGLSLTWVIVRLGHAPLVLLGWIAFFAFIRPLALALNYWLGAAAMTALVLVLLDIVYLPHGGDIHLLRVRLLDTLSGSAVALAGLLIFNPAARRHLGARLDDA